MKNRLLQNLKTRRNKIQRRLVNEGAEAFLVTDPINVTYLTGFTGDSSFLLLTRKNEIVISDTRYTTQIEEECGTIDKEIRTSKTTTMKLLCETVSKLKIRSLAIESHQVSKSTFDQLDKELAGVELISTSGIVEEFRAVKDSFELVEIRKSIDLAERSFRVIRESLRGEQTEAEIAHNLEHQIRLFGGDKCAFEPIVGVGARSALPHAVKTSKKIEESPFVLIDWGAKAGLYMSDLTRVLITGKAPAKYEKIFNIVLEAQMRAIEKIKPGVSAKEVDHAARGFIEKSGYGKKFGHGLGHGFGLQIHEAPFMSSISEATLQPGMVLTVEPGIYLPNWGGVRIEDDILVTKDGHEVLTSVPKTFEQSQVALA